MTAMNESELDGLYGELCRAISEVGEARAPLLLARFALLAMCEIGDLERVRQVLASARDCEVIAPPNPFNGQNDARTSTPTVRG